MSEYRDVFFSDDMIDDALNECRCLFQQRERDFVTVVQRLIGSIGLSLYDVRNMVEDWYNTIRDEREALGDDVTGTTPATEVAEAAAWLQRWISHPSHLHSPREQGWGRWA